MRSYSAIGCLALLALTTSTTEAAGWFGKKQGTPLLFFTLPKDSSAENDALEKCVSEVECELGVRVERMDVLRDPPSQALLGTLTRLPPPFLYNTNSCQVIHVAAPRVVAVGSDDKPKPVLIDKSRVRAWAKGRNLPPARREAANNDLAAQSNSPVVLQRTENSQDQEELLDEVNLSPLQQKGKKAIKRRTKGDSK